MHILQSTSGPVVMGNAFFAEFNGKGVRKKKEMDKNLVFSCFRGQFLAALIKTTSFALGTTSKLYKICFLDGLYFAKIIGNFRCA